jgi:hypothetical protein
MVDTNQSKVNPDFYSAVDSITPESNYSQKELVKKPNTGGRWLYLPLSGLFAWLMIPISVVTLGPMSEAIIEGTRRSPYLYRVLWPYIYRVGATFLPDTVLAWMFWFILFAAVAVLLDEYLIFWFNHSTAKLWVVIIIVTIFGIFQFETGFDLWSLFEVILITVALLLLQRNKIWWLFPLIVIATLNRETGGLIALIVLMTTYRLWLTLGLVGTWTLVYGSIRLWQGPSNNPIDVGQLLAYNLSLGNMLPFVISGMLFGWLFWLAWKGRKQAPELSRRAALVVFLYLPFVAAFGIWSEWRLYTPLFPIILPMAIVATMGDN